MRIQNFSLWVVKSEWEKGILVLNKGYDDQGKIKIQNGFESWI